MSIISINEGSSSYHDLEILDINRNVVVPTSLRYKLTSYKYILQDWTIIDPTSTSLIISGDLNTLSVDAPGLERFLIVEAIDSSGNSITGELYYEINNLIGIYPKRKGVIYVTGVYCNSYIGAATVRTA
jgi:hypothetical protein